MKVKRIKFLELQAGTVSQLTRVSVQQAEILVRILASVRSFISSLTFFFPCNADEALESPILIGVCIAIMLIQKIKITISKIETTMNISKILL